MTWTFIEFVFQYIEPSGLCVFNTNIYVADTNNNEIKIFDLNNKTLTRVSHLIFFYFVVYVLYICFDINFFYILVKP